MGRPSKESNEPSAKQRIGDAYWKLLENYEIREITVGMIVAEAKCNRGTFYYHYRDIEDAMNSLLAEELRAANLLTEGLFRMGTNDNYNVFEHLQPEFIHRLVLIVDRVGIGLAYGKMRAMVLEVWERALTLEGSKLSDEAEAFIDYYIGGVLCMLAARPPALANSTMFGGDEPVPESLVEFSRKNFRFLMNEICAAQGVPVETFLKRVEDIQRHALL